MADERDPPATRTEIFGWSMYDFANSSYTTVIITVAYAVVFSQLVVGPDDPAAEIKEYRFGNLLWSVTLSISYLLTVLLLPILGAVMDQVGRRKLFLLASTLVTVIGTAALVFAGPGMWPLAIALIIVSNIGFSVGESFIASFLPDLGPPEKLGKISGFAWGLGYVGGLLSTSIVLAALGAATEENWARQKLIGPVTAVWFLLAALPTFILLRDRSRPSPRSAGVSIMKAGFAQAIGTLRHFRHYRDLAVFFASYLCAMAGLSIVVSFAFIYGEQIIGWSSATKTWMFLITQISATLGALAFGFLQARFGDKRTYELTLILWVAAIVLIWATQAVTAFVQSSFAPGAKAEHVFLVVGCFAGLCIGATQSSGRTIVALYCPAGKAGEFFGLWGVFGKLAAIIGLLALGGLQTAYGLKNAILITGLFFTAGYVIALFVNDKRARQVANEVIPLSP